jgi:uncharacterized membrane protein
MPPRLSGMDTSSRSHFVRQAAFGLLLVLALLVGAAALRFALPGQPLAPPLPNLTLQRELLIIHAVSAGLALMLGPWQFAAGLRARHPQLHRRIGYGYATCLLVGGISALPLAAQAMGGPLAQLGFGLLGLGWLATTAIALIHVRAGRIGAHRRWMLRSFALTTAGISLRVQLGVGGVLGLPVEAIYTAVAWSCWVPNVLLAELWLWPKAQATDAEPGWEATRLGAD